MVSTSPNALLTISFDQVPLSTLQATPTQSLTTVVSLGSSLEETSSIKSSKFPASFISNIVTKSFEQKSSPTSIHASPTQSADQMTSTHSSNEQISSLKFDLSLASLSSSIVVISSSQSMNTWHSTLIDSDLYLVMPSPSLVAKVTFTVEASSSMDLVSSNSISTLPYESSTFKDQTSSVRTMPENASPSIIMDTSSDILQTPASALSSSPGDHTSSTNMITSSDPSVLPVGDYIYSLGIKSSMQSSVFHNTETSGTYSSMSTDSLVGEMYSNTATSHILAHPTSSPIELSSVIERILDSVTLTHSPVTSESTFSDALQITPSGITQWTKLSPSETLQLTPSGTTQWSQLSSLVTPQLTSSSSSQLAQPSFPITLPSSISVSRLSSHVVSDPVKVGQTVHQLTVVLNKIMLQYHMINFWLACEHMYNHC